MQRPPIPAATTTATLLATALFTLTTRALADEPTTPASVRQQFEHHALTHPGNPNAGQKLFSNALTTKCNLCHRINNDGGTAGPDLSVIGGKFDRTHLIESLLEPSRQIVEGYRTTLIQLTDGRTLTGIVKEQSTGSLTLATADGKLHTIPLRDIETRKQSDVSLMPDGLATQLTPDQFTDLVAYLETLRSGKKGSPGSGLTGPITLPSGFSLEVIATGLTGATALEALPDGRILVCEQAGSLRVIEHGRLLEQPFVTLPVENNWERGLIGVTVDPGFPKTPWIYLCWVAKDPWPHHRISRFTASGNVALPGSEVVLLEGDDQRKLGGKVPAGHQGGALHFGNDGCLYVGIGEQTAEVPAQNLDTFQGKILRIKPDGSIPADNPFLNQANGKYQSIWARGCRNPFTFAVDRTTGTLFINDVGGKFEEINRGQPGANYGWPIVDHGPTDRKDITSPIHIYPQASISGGDFSPDNPRWPAPLRRKYFFADFVHGWIKTLDPQGATGLLAASAASANGPLPATDFATGLRRPTDLRFTPDGSLLVLLRNAWVVDDKFVGGTSSVIRITPQ